MLRHRRKDRRHDDRSHFIGLAQATTDGAGVRLSLVIGKSDLLEHDTFLLFDAFRSDHPDTYTACSPGHRHRGFETVTCTLAGRMGHRDSRDNENEDVLEPGSVQWMTPATGLVELESPSSRRAGWRVHRGRAPRVFPRTTVTAAWGGRREAPARPPLPHHRTTRPSPSAKDRPMTHLLLVNSSASGDTSVSRRLTTELVERLRADEPSLRVTVRDVGADPLPHLDVERLPGLGGSTETEEARDTARLADELVAELKAADLLVIGTPMYNFGITSTLKAWFDHVLRAGVTFAYTAEGSKGLLENKRAVVVETRGGSYSDGPAAVMDAQEPHLRAMLGLVGITDVTFVHAECLAVSPEARASAINEAAGELRALSLRNLVRAA